MPGSGMFFYRRLSDESAVSLVEVIVASFILSVVLAGLATSTVNVLNLARSNANRAIAANLAASEIQTLQTIPFDELDDRADDGDTTGPSFLGTHSRQETVDGIDFTVERTISWATNDADPGPCSAVVTPADENILAVDVEVTWAPLRFSTPVRSQTTIAPPIAEYDNLGGVIAVFVTTSSVPPVPIENVLVTITGPDPATTVRAAAQPTASDGCFLVAGLPTGDYDVEVEKPFYVDAATGDPVVSETAGVQTGARTNVVFQLEQRAAVSVSLEGRDGGLVPSSLPRYVVQADQPPFAVGSSDSDERFVPPGLYQTWAGFCDDADPGPGDRGTPVELAPLVTTAVTAQLASLDIGWVGGTEASATTLELWAEHVGDCENRPDGVDRELQMGTIQPGQQVQIALPWGGPWRLYATDGSTTVAEAVEVDGAPASSVALDPSQPVPSLLLELSTPLCVPAPPFPVGSPIAQGFSDTPGTPENTFALSEPAQAGDVIVLDVVSEASLAHLWEPSGSGWFAIPAGDGFTSRTWARFATEGEASITVTRPWSGSFHYWGTVHVNVYRNVSHLPPSGDRIVARNTNSATIPGIAVDDGEFALLHTNVAVTNRNSLSWINVSGSASRGSLVSMPAFGGTWSQSFFESVGSGATGERTVTRPGNTDILIQRTVFRAACP